MFTLYYLITQAFPTTPWMLKVFLSSPPAIFGAAMALLKVNGFSFMRFLEIFFYYLTSPKKYGWKKKEETKNLDILEFTEKGSLDQNIQESSQLKPKKIQRKSLKSLSTRLDMELE